MKHNILDILKEQKQIKLKGNIYHLVQTKSSYNTNRIEGSTLTEEQTNYIFETNTLINIGDFTKIDDIIETKNHFKLFDYMLDTIEERLDETLIKKYHEILKSNTTDSEKEWFNVGDYKSLDNYVGNMKTSKVSEVSSHIKELLNWYDSAPKTLETITEFHVRFETIHPFQDGNGRVGRIIMFRETLKNNIIPFIIDEKRKHYYYRGLAKYRLGEKEWLLDTNKSAQDDFIKLCTPLLEEWR